MRWTEEQLNKYQNKHNKSASKVNIQKPSKYRNIKTKIDGHTFDSKKEADFYQELKLRLLAGDILSFCLQPKFILSNSITYRPDFIIFEKDRTRVVDVKGYETEVFKIKKKLFEEKFKIELEVIF